MFLLFLSSSFPTTYRSIPLRFDYLQAFRAASAPVPTDEKGVRNTDEKIKNIQAAATVNLARCLSKTSARVEIRTWRSVRDRRIAASLDINAVSKRRASGTVWLSVPSCLINGFLCSDHGQKYCLALF